MKGKSRSEPSSILATTQGFEHWLEIIFISSGGQHKVSSFFWGGWLQITKQFSSKQQIILSGALFARRIFGDVELYLSALHEGDTWGGSESRLSNVDEVHQIVFGFPSFLLAVDIIHQESINYELPE